MALQQKSDLEMRSSKRLAFKSQHETTDKQFKTSKWEGKNSVISGNTNHMWTETAQPRQADSRTPRSLAGLHLFSKGKSLGLAHSN